MKNDILLFAVMFAVAWIGFNVAKDRLLPTASETIVSEDVAADATTSLKATAAEATPSAIAIPKPATDPAPVPASDQKSTDDEPKNSTADSQPTKVASATKTESAEPKSTEQKIEQVLVAQVKAWNQGDLDGFMNAYWNDEALTISGGGDTTLGWDATYANYREKYPEGEMGAIDFKDLRTDMVGKESAIVTGRFDHQLADEKVKGNFSLVVKIIDGQWKIIHDHTSVAK